MTDICADDELASLSEFTFLKENAGQAGVTGALPAVERIDSGRISALKFGDGAPRVVFLHGGGQNAHTWDTVILGLGEPALAVDLPGHGRSAWREDGDYGPKLNATAVEPVVARVRADADLVVGMSLGGLTALRLAATAPELVRKLVLVDVTPSAPERHNEMTEEQKGTVALVQGDRTFPTFEAMLEVTVAAAPHRDRESLRRGVFHNAKRLDDGTWTWRYDSFRKGEGFDGLWDDVPNLTMPTTLVRGANSFFVNDDDAAEFARIAPGFQRVHIVENSGPLRAERPAARADRHPARGARPLRRATALDPPQGCTSRHRRDLRRDLEPRTRPVDRPDRCGCLRRAPAHAELSCTRRPPVHPASRRSPTCRRFRPSGRQPRPVSVGRNPPHGACAAQSARHPQRKVQASACDLRLQVRRRLLQACPQHQRQRVLRRHRQGGVAALDAAGRWRRGAGRRRRFGAGRLRDRRAARRDAHLIGGAGRDAAGHEVHLGRTQQRGRRRRRRRLPAGGGDQLGRPDPARTRRSSTSRSRAAPRSAASSASTTTSPGCCPSRVSRTASCW